MNPTPENETPLTDAAWERTFAEDCRSPYTDMRDFARELERDRKRLIISLMRDRDRIRDIRKLLNEAEYSQALDQAFALDAKLSKETT